LRSVLYLTNKVWVLDITPFIRELILSNECVILRGVGGFDTSYMNAALNKDKKLILPPGKRITFRPDWIKDNGSLENHIAGSLHIKAEEASKYIDLYVNNLLTQLENKGSIELAGIGSFKKNNLKKLEFTAIEDENYLADSFGLDILDIEIEDEPIQKDAYTAPEIKKIAPPRRKKTKWIVAIGLLLLLFLITTLIYFSGKQGIPIFNSSDKPEIVSEQSEVIVFGKKSDALEDSVTQAIEQTLDKNTAPKEALSPTITNEVVNPEPTTELIGHSYLLVAGSFKSLKNANILKVKLENKGFKPEITNEGNFVRVILGKFENKEEANAELKRTNRYG
jgi:cell division septation protein DedD